MGKNASISNLTKQDVEKACRQILTRTNRNLENVTKILENYKENDLDKNLLNRLDKRLDELSSSLTQNNLEIAACKAAIKTKLDAPSITRQASLK